MKYDLMITCMFSLSKDKYIKAFQNFLKYGLLNIKNKKIILNALVCERDKKAFENIKFPYPVNFFYFEKDTIGEKIYSFYVNNSTYISNSTRWHIQVDDDSSTDISGLVDRLDSIYDYNIPMHLTCGELHDFHPKIKEVLLNNNIIIEKQSNNLEFIPTYWVHEWECSIQSHGFFKKILENIDILTSLINENVPSDHGLSLMAFINKIPVIPCKFIHFANLIDQFSLNGGKYYHIHYLKDENYKNLINSDFIREYIIGKKFKFFELNNLKKCTLFCENFILNEDFSIKSCNENESFWKIKDDILIILNKDRQMTSYFRTSKKLFEKNKVLVGQFNLHQNKNFAFLKMI